MTVLSQGIPIELLALEWAQGVENVNSLLHDFIVELSFKSHSLNLAHYPLITFSGSFWEKQASRHLPRPWELDPCDHMHHCCPVSVIRCAVHKAAAASATKDSLEMQRGF